MRPNNTLRIIAGEWRGHRIKVPAGVPVRPTRDRVREAWMSIVQSYLPGARVADLCAGSGALGIEALSRGAASCEFVDTSTQSIAVLKGNLDALGATPRAKIHHAGALQFVNGLPEHSFDVVFADPPYAADIAVGLAQRWLESPYATLLGIEHSSAVTLPPGGEARRYGASSITFYRAG